MSNKFSFEELLEQTALPVEITNTEVVPPVETPPVVEETKVEETVAVEGVKGAVIGGLVGALAFGIGVIPGAIIGHFWQEYLIEKEKNLDKIKEELDELKKNNKNGLNDKKIEIKEFVSKKLKTEIDEIKPKANKEKEDSKKKVAKEEITEINTTSTTETETEEVVPPLAETQVDIAIEEITNEIEHQEEVVDGLTALRTIATKIETPSPVEVALFRVAANMAVAGRDEDAQDIIPSMESKKPIDIKGFDEKIKATKKKIDLLKVELANLEAKKKLG